MMPLLVGVVLPGCRDLPHLPRDPLVRKNGIPQIVPVLPVSPLDNVVDRGQSVPRMIQMAMFHWTQTRET